MGIPYELAEGSHQELLLPLSIKIGEDFSTKLSFIYGSRVKCRVSGLERDEGSSRNGAADQKACRGYQIPLRP